MVSSEVRIATVSRVERWALTSITYSRTLGFHRGRIGGLASEPVTGHRRLNLDGGDAEGSGERMSSRGVAGGVGGDERLRPVGLTAQHLLRDVAAQAEPDQDDLPGRHVVQQGQGVLDRGVEPERATRRPVPPQVRHDDMETTRQRVDLRSPRVVVECGAVQQNNGRCLGWSARPVVDHRVGAQENVFVQRDHSCSFTVTAGGR